MKTGSETRAAGNQLSKREKELLAAAAAGFLDKHTALRLGVSDDTIRTYWRRIRSKLGNLTRSALVAHYVGELSGLRPTEESVESIFDWEIDCEKRTFRRLPRGPTPNDKSGSDWVPLEDILSNFHPEDRDGVRNLLEYVDNSDIEHFYYVARTQLPPPMHLGHAFALVLRGPEGKGLRILGRRVPFYDLRFKNDPVA